MTEVPQSFDRFEVFAFSVKAGWVLFTSPATPDSIARSL